MSRKTLPIAGLESLRAYNAFHTLMLGLKMLPAYMGESYEEFYDKIEKMPIKDQEKMVREALLFVPLSKEEIEALLLFAVDPNGVEYTKNNIKNLGPKGLIEAIVPVCMDIASIKIDLVTEDEKKNLKISQ